VQKLIFDNFIPSTGQEISDYLLSFSDKARRLTFVGTGMLIVSAYLMLKNIENSFNTIWRVRQGRSGMANFLLYWAILSLGPLLLGGGILISTYLFSLSFFSDSGSTGSALLGLLPLVFNFGTFTLIYAAVPNCRVPLRHAAIGGALTTLLFSAVKSVFTWSVGMSSYQLIYGAFAALPLFLLWIYISWLMLLVGAEFVHALTSYRSRRATRLNDMLFAVAVLQRSWAQHQQGETLREQDILSKEGLIGGITVSATRWRTIRDQLLNANLLRLTDTADYLPGTDVAQISLWNLQTVISPLDSQGSIDSRTLPAWFRSAITLLEDAERGMREPLDLSLLELFKTATPEHPDAA